MSLRFLCSITYAQTNHQPIWLNAATAMEKSGPTEVGRCPCFNGRLAVVRATSTIWTQKPVARPI